MKNLFLMVMCTIFSTASYANTLVKTSDVYNGDASFLHCASKVGLFGYSNYLTRDIDVPSKVSDILGEDYLDPSATVGREDVCAVGASRPSGGGGFGEGGSSTARFEVPDFEAHDRRVLRKYSELLRDNRRRKVLPEKRRKGKKWGVSCVADICEKEEECARRKYVKEKVDLLARLEGSFGVDEPARDLMKLLDGPSKEYYLKSIVRQLYKNTGMNFNKVRVGGGRKKFNMDECLTEHASSTSIRMLAECLNDMQKKRISVRKVAVKFSRNFFRHISN